MNGFLFPGWCLPDEILLVIEVDIIMTISAHIFVACIRMLHLKSAASVMYNTTQLVVHAFRPQPHGFQMGGCVTYIRTILSQICCRQERVLYTMQMRAAAGLSSRDAHKIGVMHSIEIEWGD